MTDTWAEMLSAGQYAVLATGVFAGVAAGIFAALLFLRMFMWVFAWFGLRS